MLLARLFVCLLLAAGVLTLLAPLCADGMAIAMPAAAKANDTQPMIADHGSSCDAPMMGFSALHCGPSDGSAALVAAGVTTESDAALMVCIVILVAILVTVLGLRRPWWSRAAPPPSQAGPGALARSLRGPVLVELCVLRT